MQNLLLDLSDNLWLSNNVSNTHSETSMYEPVVNDKLNVGQNIGTSLWAKILPDNVDETTSGRSYNSLCDDSLENFTLLDDHCAIVGIDEIASFFKINHVWNDQ